MRHQPATKLTEQAVRQIRASKEELKVLAARYGVSISRVSHVKNYLAWKHVE